MEASLAPLVVRPHSSACTSMRSADQPLQRVSSGQSVKLTMANADHLYGLSPTLLHGRGRLARAH